MTTVGDYLKASAKNPLGGMAMDELKNQKLPTKAEAFSVPYFTINGKKFLLTVQDCAECCRLSNLCCSQVAFVGDDGKGSYRVRHGCDCLPCCCSYNIENEKGNIGSFKPAGCCDVPLLYCICPSIYCGPIMRSKFVSKGETKFVLKTDIAPCQCCREGCARFLSCIGCINCYRFFTGKSYVYSRQPIYRHVLDKDPVAFFSYVTRQKSLLPCVGDEKVLMNIKELSPLSEDETSLLSLYLILFSGKISPLAFGLPWIDLAMRTPSPSGMVCMDSLENIHTDYIGQTLALNVAKSQKGVYDNAMQAQQAVEVRQTKML